MSTLVSVPLEIFGLGFAISMAIACLIQFMLVVIRTFSKKSSNEK